METSKSTISCCLLPSRKNIRKAVIVIALVGAILQTISITTSKWPPTPTPAVGPFLIAFVYGVNVLHILMYLSLLVAQAKGNPHLYLPFLVYEGITLLLMLVVCVGLTVAFFAAQQSWIDEYNKRFPEHPMTLEDFRFLCGFGILSTGLGAAVMAWCYAVIVRAYNFLKENRRNEAHQLLKEEEH